MYRCHLLVQSLFKIDLFVDELQRVILDRGICRTCAIPFFISGWHILLWFSEICFCYLNRPLEAWLLFSASVLEEVVSATSHAPLDNPLNSLAPNVGKPLSTMSPQRSTWEKEFRQNMQNVSPQINKTVSVMFLFINYFFIFIILCVCVCVVGGGGGGWWAGRVTYRSGTLTNCSRTLFRNCSGTFVSAPEHFCYFSVVLTKCSGTLITASEHL